MISNRWNRWASCGPRREHVGQVGHVADQVGAQHAAPLPTPYCTSPVFPHNHPAIGSPARAIDYRGPGQPWHRLQMERPWHPRVSMHRRSIRLRGYDYSRPGAYFVTICANTHLFGRVRAGEMVVSEFGAIARDCWTSIPDHFSHVRLDAFVVMPDHVHGILMLRDYPSRTSAIGRIRAGSLGTIVRSFKSVVAARINLLRGARVGGIWQRNFFDEIIRTEADLDRARQYIKDNPARWDPRRSPRP